MKKRHIISLLIILTFFIFSFVTFTDSISPYVSFAEAKNIKGTVQVKGSLKGDKVAFFVENKKLTFHMRDENDEEVLIIYAGAKPEGLEQASNIVVIGKYQDNQFMAEKLLVKCPSKYQRSVN